MKKEVDLRGLTCPEPVLQTKKILDDQSFENLVVLVDSEINVKNLERLAKTKNVVIQSEPKDEHFKVQLAKSDEVLESESVAAVENSKSEVGTVVFIGKDTFGEGDEDFSKSLLNVFLQTMFESGHRPRAVLMANSGVKLMANDSSVKPVLEKFREAGADVLACGLCVEFYELTESVPVDQITNMYAICEYMMSADKVITP